MQDKKFRLLLLGLNEYLARQTIWDKALAQDSSLEDTPPQRLFSNPLVRELTVVLVIKLTILYFIWFAFFSEPVTPKLTSDKVAETIFGDGASSLPTHNKSQ